jgi:hypothetical protein
VPVVLVLVVTMYIELMLFLWHNLLLRSVELTLFGIAISALVNALVYESTSWLAIKLLLVGMFIGQLLYKGRDYSGCCWTIDLGAQFDL